MAESLQKLMNYCFLFLSYVYVVLLNLIRCYTVLFFIQFKKQNATSLLLPIHRNYVKIPINSYFTWQNGDLLCLRLHIAVEYYLFIAPCSSFSGLCSPDTKATKITKNYSYYKSTKTLLSVNSCYTKKDCAVQFERLWSTNRIWKVPPLPLLMFWIRKKTIDWIWVSP